MRLVTSAVAAGKAVLTERQKENGVAVVFIDAYDWNVGFFKKNGYTAVGAWEDVPKGHVTYILEKRF